MMITRMVTIVLLFVLCGVLVCGAAFAQGSCDSGVCALGAAEDEADEAAADEALEGELEEMIDGELSKPLDSKDDITDKIFEDRQEDHKNIDERVRAAD